MTQTRPPSPFARLDNFRDFGGYPTRDGRSMVKGRLFRSAHLADLTDEDLEHFANLDIEVIVDLRGPGERGRKPGRRHAGFAGTVIQDEMDEALTSTWMDWVRQSDDVGVHGFRAYMRNFYRAAPADPRYVALYRRYFEALSEARGGLIVHCAAGKDRTGVICALTQHLAGVPEEHILHDYMLTRLDDFLTRQVDGIVANTLKQTGKVVAREAVAAALGVEEEFLRAAFAMMTERYGSVDGYLEQELGLDADRRAAVLARIVA